MNLSARQFRQPNLSAMVIGILRETGFRPHDFELELTESSIMQNAEAAVRALGELKDAGVKIAIDDFGTGYSSLGYLKRLPERCDMKRTILYLDDEAGCLSVFQETFGREYDVRTATTPAEARRMLAEQPADIVISDQTMPEIRGTDFLSEVAATHPSSYRVLLTGSVHLVSVFPEVSAGIIHLFVPKPWTAQDMRQMLKRASIHF